MFPNFEKFTLMKPNETTTSDSTGNNTLLAVSGLPDLYKIRNHFVTTLPTGEVTAWNMICWAKDFTRYMDEIIQEAEKAACASGAVDKTVRVEMCSCGAIGVATRHGIDQCEECGKPV